MTTEMLMTALVAILGGGHVWAWLSSRGKHKTDLIELGQSIAERTILAMSAERGALLERIDKLETAVNELLAHAEALEAALERHGIQPPARPRMKATR